jgi:hypothetical protein
VYAPESIIYLDASDKIIFLYIGNAPYLSQAHKSGVLPPPEKLLYLERKSESSLSDLNNEEGVL